jgi:hypothetical protein
MEDGFPVLTRRKNLSGRTAEEEAAAAAARGEGTDGRTGSAFASTGSGQRRVRPADLLLWYGAAW